MLGNESARMPLLLLVILLAASSSGGPTAYHSNLNSNPGSCRKIDGSPICCTGRTNCLGVNRVSHYNYIYTRKGYNSEGNAAGSPPRAMCFCDEYCVNTNDCCWDYRDLCSMPKVNCEVSDWSPWSTCSKLCGKGSQTRRRTILRLAANGGDQCPLLMETKECPGVPCRRRRVGRSEHNFYHFMELPMELANLLPVQGDIAETIKQFDMRWDIRRKLYYGRLIQQNKTDTPDPEPYCVHYEIVKASDACRSQVAYTSPPFDQHYLMRRQGYIDTDKPWLTTHSSMRPAQRICATCYPKYMRRELGNRCPGTGYLGMTSRWRTLNTYNCQGTFRMISQPQKACTCGRQPNSFILT